LATFLRSTNGTRVNDELIGKGKSKVLKTGDVIHLPLKDAADAPDAAPKSMLCSPSWLL
jgi:hypothetical protein